MEISKEKGIGVDLGGGYGSQTVLLNVSSCAPRGYSGRGWIMEEIGVEVLSFDVIGEGSLKGGIGAESFVVGAFEVENSLVKNAELLGMCEGGNEVLVVDSRT